jgi:hypothetical protein
LLRTAEKYKNALLPSVVIYAVTTKYPKWGISKDVFLVNYFDTDGGNAIKKYKLVPENGNQRIRVEVNEHGEFS